MLFFITHIRKQSILVFALFTAIALLNSCDKTRVMEENQQIKDASWAYEDDKTFTADINDTSQVYNIYINVRHSFQFEWRNVWVNIETTFPDGKKMDKRVNLVLSEPDGHWFGECTGDNCYLPVLIQANAWFPQPGKYSFKVAQDMRVNPLANLKSVGMRIEKVVEEKK
jgi:gliding motility-associated lipoprotein GldH